MKKGDRVSFRGRTGTVTGFMPQGMVDVRFDDASHRVERRSSSDLAPAARSNPRSREEQERELRWLIEQERVRLRAGGRQARIADLPFDPRTASLGEQLAYFRRRQQEAEAAREAERASARSRYGGGAVTRPERKARYRKKAQERAARRRAQREAETARGRETEAIAKRRKKGRMAKITKKFGKGWRRDPYVIAEAFEDDLLPQEEFEQAMRRVRERALRELAGLSVAKVRAGEVPPELAALSVEQLYMMAQAQKPPAPPPTEEPPEPEDQEERQRTRARAAAGRRAAASAASRVASTRSRKVTGKLDADVQRAIKSAGVGVFTRPDPPRQSADRKAYCGNPIDGTAYYLVVDNTRRGLSEWITWDRVAQAARMAGVSWDTQGDWHVLRATASRSTTADKLLRDKIKPQLRQYLVSSTWMSVGEEPSGFMLPPDDGVLDLFIDAARVSIGQESAEEGWKKASVRKGAELVVRVPSAEKAQKLWLYFPTFERTQKSRPGVDLVPVDLGHTKYIRARGGKRGSPPLAKTMRTAMELAPGREKKVGFAGSWPDEARAFKTYDPETGKVQFYRLYHGRSPGRDKLRSFEPYTYRVLVAPIDTAVPQADIEQWGYLPAAIHLASKQQRGQAISKEVAYMLVVSGGVRVRRQLMLRPSIGPDRVPPGAKISIWFGDKAKSPFFSWVPTTVPLQALQAQDEERRSIWSPCLSEEDEEVRNLLRKTKSVFQRYQGAFGRVQSLFARLSQIPSSLRDEREDPTFGRWERSRGGRVKSPRYMSDVRRAVSDISRAYAAVYRWVQRLRQRAGAGDLAAARALQDLRNTQLGLTDPDSAFSKSIRMFHAKSGGEQMIVGPDGRMRPAPATPGLVQFIPSEREGEDDEAEGAVLDMAQYLNFMKYLSARLMLPAATAQVPAPMKAQKRGEKRPDEPEGLIGPRQVQMVTVALIRPGLSAWRWLQGADIHPHSDLFTYVTPSLHPSASKRLVYLQGEAGSTGARELRELQPLPASTLTLEQVAAQESQDPDELTSLQAAIAFRDYVGLYAIGGLYGRSGMRYDPMSRKHEFILQTPPSWPISGAEQADANWAINLVVSDVYPALVWQNKESPAQARERASQLLLLARLYDELGGYQLAGPLNPVEREPQDGLLRGVVKDISKATIEVMGGSAGLSSTGNYTVFKTYNPVLFEVTRLYWPHHREERDVGWKTLLSQAKYLRDIDTVGRFGTAASLTQQFALRSQGEAQISNAILQQISTIAGQTLNNIFSNQWQSDPRATPQDVPPSYYATFRLMWPLGVPLDWAMKEPSTQATYEGLALWKDDPLSFLRMLKAQVSQSITQVLSLRSFGVGSGFRLPAEGVIGEIREGKRTLDPDRVPRTGEARRARAVLSSALDPKGEFLSDPYESKRRKRAEKKALSAFQRRPVKGRRYGRTGQIESYELPPVPETGVYDAPTLQRLETHRRSAKKPPARAPFILGQQEEIRGTQGLITVGQKAIYSGDPVRGLRGSALHEAEQQREALGERIQLIDEALKALDRRKK